MNKINLFNKIEIAFNELKLFGVEVIDRESVYLTGDYDELFSSTSFVVLFSLSINESRYILKETFLILLKVINKLGLGGIKKLKNKLITSFFEDLESFLKSDFSNKESNKKIMMFKKQVDFLLEKDFLTSQQLESNKDIIKKLNDDYQSL